MMMFTGRRYFMATLVVICAFGLLMTACFAPKTEAPEPAEAVETVEAISPAISEEQAETTEPVAPAAEEAPVEPVAALPETVEPEADSAAETDELVEPTPPETVASGTSTVTIIEGTPEKPEVLDPDQFQPELRPYADSPYAEKIDAGLMWLAANREQQTCSYMDFYVLDYLQRKFALDDWFTAEAIIDPESLDAASRVDYKLHARLVKQDYNLGDAKIPFAEATLFADYTPQENEEFITAAALEHLGVSPSGAMLRAMYCDQAAVDEAFVAELLRLSREIESMGSANLLGGYIVTHAIMSYQWMKENGCADAFAELADVGDEFADKLVAIVEDQGLKTDLALEAMAFLHYLGYADRVQPEWVEAVANAQLEEGSWDRHGGNSARQAPQGHTTAFALWILLENALPEASLIPWLR